MSGCSKLTLAKFVDIFGRIEGFLLMLFIAVLSLILNAVCADIEMYFAAHTLYWIGHIGLIVSIDAPEKSDSLEILTLYNSTLSM